MYIYFSDYHKIIDISLVSAFIQNENNNEKILKSNINDSQISATTVSVEHSKSNMKLALEHKKENIIRNILTNKQFFVLVFICRNNMRREQLSSILYSLRDVSEEAVSLPICHFFVVSLMTRLQRWMRIFLFNMKFYLHVNSFLLNRNEQRFKVQNFI